MRTRLLLLSPLILLAFVLFVTLGGVIVRQLWNWLLPPLFGWHPVTFWQALGLLALCRILFGGLGLNGSYGPRARWRERTVPAWLLVTASSTGPRETLATSTSIGRGRNTVIRSTTSNPTAPAASSHHRTRRPI